MHYTKVLSAVWAVIYRVEIYYTPIPLSKAKKLLLSGLCLLQFCSLLLRMVYIFYITHKAGAHHQEITAALSFNVPQNISHEGLFLR